MMDQGGHLTGGSFLSYNAIMDLFRKLEIDEGDNDYENKQDSLRSICISGFLLSGRHG